MMPAVASGATVVVRAVVIGMIRERGRGLDRGKAQQDGDHQGGETPSAV
jgi:hypothetical protein